MEFIWFNKKALKEAFPPNLKVSKSINMRYVFWDIDKDWGIIGYNGEKDPNSGNDNEGKSA